MRDAGHQRERGAEAPLSLRAGSGGYCDSTYLARVAASCSLTCGFAGMGTWPQLPTPPSRIFLASVAGAFLSFLYFAATSLYAGPTSFLSTAWHARQFFCFASSALANAGPPTTIMPSATTAKAFFIRDSVSEGVRFSRFARGSTRPLLQPVILT